MSIPFDSESISLLFVLPFFNMMMIGAHFLWVPLHFLNQNWSLSTLGIVFGIAGFGRLFSVPMINYLGDYSCIFLFSPSWILTLWVCLSDENDPVPLYIMIPMMQVSNCILPLQGLIQLKYGVSLESEPTEPSSPSEPSEISISIESNTEPSESPIKSSVSLHKSALRIFTAAETLGYATATLFGGFVYEYGGGWRSCAWVQLAWLTLQIIAFVTSATVHRDFKNQSMKAGNNKKCWRRCCCCCKSATATTAASNSTRSKPTTTLVNGKEMTDAEIFLYIRCDLFVLLVAHCTSVFAYSIEFVLFAVYFKQVFGWSSTWTGAAQMSGDLLAASILFGSVCLDNKKKTNKETEEEVEKMEKVKTSSSRNGCIGCCKVIYYAPFNITFLLLCVVVLYALICIPIFAIAVLSQILMGTVYVFGVQLVNEYLSKLSFGSRQLYRRITFYGRIAYDLSFCLAGFLGLIIYDNIDPVAPFYIISVLALLWTIIYTIKMSYFSKIEY